MGTPVIVEAVRTPIGKRGGWLAGLHAAELLGAAQRRGRSRGPASTRTWSSRSLGGCVTQAGEQSSNVTRTAWLHAGLPYQTGCLTVDAQCGSAQQAAHLIAGADRGGRDRRRHRLRRRGDVAGPAAAPTSAPDAGTPRPGRWDIDLPNQFVAAERIAERRGLTRDQVDEFGLRSQRNAERAWRRAGSSGRSSR